MVLFIFYHTIYPGYLNCIYVLYAIEFELLFDRKTAEFLMKTELFIKGRIFQTSQIKTGYHMKQIPLLIFSASRSRLQVL